MRLTRYTVTLLLALVMALPVWAENASVPKDEARAEPKPAAPTYEQEVDHVYATIDGEDFHMDIFTPNDKQEQKGVEYSDEGDGIGIVDIASGAWFSGRDKIQQHKMARIFTIFCARGYTVFAVRPGTRPKYDAMEMVDHVKAAIRYIKANADKYDIDPDRLGLTGASAGGHLASLTALLAEDDDPEATDPLLKHDTHVAAVGIFFPPTDFLDWEGRDNAHDFVGNIYWRGGVEGRTEEEIKARAKEISPRHQVRPDAPPFLIYHGDADPLVPLSQSEVLVEALKELGNQAELRVKVGGGHPWLTIPEEVAKIADWMDEQLGEEKTAAN